jgi:hypothetical protein
MSVTSYIPYVVSTCGHSSTTSTYAMSRHLVALVALGAGVGFATPAPAAADPAGDPGNVATLQPPAPKASTTITADDRFLADIARAGMRVSDVRAAIAGGHDVCAYLAAGHNALDVIAQGIANNPTMTRSDEIAAYNAAVSAYCPQRLRLSGSLA